jgi:hypothetical protein
LRASKRSKDGKLREICEIVSGASERPHGDFGNQGFESGNWNSRYSALPPNPPAAVLPRRSLKMFAASPKSTLALHSVLQENSTKRRRIHRS